MRFLVMHGPNLNMTGIREPSIYGNRTLSDINESIAQTGKELGVEVDFFQSNSEGALIDKIQQARGVYDGVVLNAGAYTHYSYAIADAISSVSLPFVEVHISNVFARESFRGKSVLSPVCAGVIAGLGEMGYRLALRALAEKVSK